MLLQLARTAGGGLAARPVQAWDRADATPEEALRPLLLALASAGAPPGRLADLDASSLLLLLGWVKVVPDSPEIPAHLAGCVARVPLFHPETLLWVDRERGLLAIEKAPRTAGIYVFSADRCEIDVFPSLALDLTTRNLRLRGTPLVQRPAGGCWPMDGSASLTAWNPQEASLELRLDSVDGRLGLDAVPGGWRPEAGPSACLPGLGWSPALARRCRARLAWAGGGTDVPAGTSGMGLSSVVLRDPLPEEVAFELDLDLVPVERGVAAEAGKRRVSARMVWAIRTTFRGLALDSEGGATDVLSTGSRADRVLLRGQGPRPATLSVQVHRSPQRPSCAPGAATALAARIVSEPGEDPARYECDGLTGLLAADAGPAVLRFVSPGQEELGSVALVPEALAGRWRVQGARSMAWEPECDAAHSALLRPVPGPDGRTTWQAEAREPFGRSAILRSPVDLKVGSCGVSRLLPLRLSGPPRLRRTSPWDPIRAGGAETVDVTFEAPAVTAPALTLWLPTFAPSKVACAPARTGQVRVSLPRSVARSLHDCCGRLDLSAGRGASAVWGWLHRTEPHGAGRWIGIDYSGDFALLPADADLFVDLFGLCSRARLASARSFLGSEDSTALLLASPWPIDGRAPTGVDGAFLAPVQAAVTTSPDRRQSHVYLQDARQAEPLHLVLEREGGSWRMASDDIPDAECALLGSVGRDGEGTLRWHQRLVTGLDEPGTLLAWRGRLLDVSPPEEPVIRFAGWIWTEPGEVVEDCGTLGRYGLRRDGGAGGAARWTGRLGPSGFEWKETPPPEVLASTGLREAGRRGADPARPLHFEAGAGAEVRTYTLLARRGGSAFDPMDVTLVEGALAAAAADRPLRAWRLAHELPGQAGGSR